MLPQRKIAHAGKEENTISEFPQEIPHFLLFQLFTYPRVHFKPSTHGDAYTLEVCDNEPMLSREWQVYLSIAIDVRTQQNDRYLRNFVDSI